MKIKYVKHVFQIKKQFFFFSNFKKSYKLFSSEEQFTKQGLQIYSKK